MVMALLFVPLPLGPNSIKTYMEYSLKYFSGGVSILICYFGTVWWWSKGYSPATRYSPPYPVGGGGGGGSGYKWLVQYWSVCSPTFCINQHILHYVKQHICPFPPICAQTWWGKSSNRLICSSQTPLSNSSDWCVVFRHTAFSAPSFSACLQTVIVLWSVVTDPADQTGIRNQTWNCGANALKFDSENGFSSIKIFSFSLLTIKQNSFCKMCSKKFGN